MKNTLKQLTLLGIHIGFAVPAFAGSIWSAADSAAPFAVRYKDSAAVGTITITSTAITCTDDGEANAISLSSGDNDTLSDIVAAINASTNGTGVKNFEAVLWAGLAADATTNSYFIARSAATVDRQWDYDNKWDTSNVKRYDAAVGTLVNTTYVNEGQIDRIFGNAIGTGDVTISVYVDGSVKWQRSITSPVYVKAEDNATNVADNAVFFDYEVGIDVGNQPAFVRAARATTATTGGIGLSESRR